jgi:hypothetical protein
MPYGKGRELHAVVDIGYALTYKDYAFSNPPLRFVMRTRLLTLVLILVLPTLCAARQGSSSYLPLSGTLNTYEWAEITQSEDVRFLVSAGGTEVACSPVSWFGSFGLVKDTPQGREVVTAYGNEARVKELLGEAVRDRAAVSLYGRRRRAACSPEWVWLVSSP